MSSGTIRFATRVATWTLLSGLAGLAACGASAPHKFGQFADLSPAVVPTKGERQPLHLTIQLGRPANVAVFYVVPGRGSLLLFPEDSTSSSYVESGSHLVATSLAKSALSDSSRLIRRPANSIPTNSVPNNGRTNGRAGNGSFGDAGPLGFAQHGYLLMYASQEALPYSVLAKKISGLSLPAYDDDALNTVTKLIRENSHTNGPWAAYATDFPP
ncbi:MAG: hypothetical protein ABI442_15905 [Gemmatimonadaceae bacterium]